MNKELSKQQSLRAARFLRRHTSVSGPSTYRPASRMSRHSRMSHMSLPTWRADEYRIRKSLADYVREELDLEGRALFHQRVIIVGKNPHAAVVAKPVAAKLSDSELKKDGDRGVELSTKQSVAHDLYAILSKKSIFSTHSLQPTLSLKADSSTTSESGTTDIEEALPVPEVIPEVDFKTNLRDRLLQIHKKVYKETFTIDQLNGLCLCMGEYTLLVLEGADDMVGEYCTELAKIADELWTVNRVLQVQDRIQEMYFSTLLHRFCSPININEKFATATPNDEYLMAQQHWQLIEKMRKVCETLATDVDHHKDSSLMTCDKFRQLHAERFNKLLPEVQRLELVLNSTRFYRSVQDYATIYWYIPMEQDVDAVIWPVPYGFTPLGVFERSPFDVNLTFGDYGQAEEKADDAAPPDGESTSEQ